MSPDPKARSIVRRLLSVAGWVLVVVVVCLEIGSRIADALLAARHSAPDFDLKRDEAEGGGKLDKLSLAALEHGSVKRALEVGQARSEPHPYLGYALKPNFKTPPGVANQASHNSLGLRGKETTLEKPPGVFRIVTTGGSSVYGQSETHDDAVWSRRLEGYLNAARPNARIEVLNCGVSGWSSFEMLINLELRALDLAPDLVIVYEAINDMRCALYKPGGPVQRDNTHWRAPWPVDRPSAVEAWLSKSRTYLVWRRYFTDYVSSRADLGFYAIKNYLPHFPEDPYLHDPAALPELGFSTYRRNLNAIVSAIQTRGAKPVFVTQALARWHLDDAPSRAAQLAAFDRIQAIQRDVATERGVALYECAALIEAAIEAELLAEIARLTAADPSRDALDVERQARKTVRTAGQGLFKNDVHPHDSGSDLIARTIADWLLTTDLIPR